MKRQSVCIVPRSPIPKRKVGKSNKRRFVSKPMKKIQKEVERRRANFGNGRNGKDQQTMQGINKKIDPPVMNKLCKVNYTGKDQRDNQALPQSKQHLIDSGKVGQRKLDAMKEVFPPVTMTPESDKLVKSTVMNLKTSSKMKQGFVHHASEAKMSSQPINLKAMQGLVLNRKRRFTVDQGQACKRERKDGCNDNLGSSEELHDNLHLSSRKQLHDNLGSRKETEEKLKPHDDDNGSEGENITHRTKKRQTKYIETNENEDDDDGLDGVEFYSTRLTSQDDILKDCHDGVSMPFAVDCLGKQCYCCSKPIDEPIWRGLLSTGKEYIPLFGHLSTKSCEKVRNLSKSLSRVVEVTKLPRSKVWPKRWDESRPLNDNIGLYLFPHKMRPDLVTTPRFDKSHDQLLKEVMENDLALRAIIGDIEMLMFPSSLLPQRYQTFQMKHYLWGVFKPKEVEGKCVAQCQPDHTGATATGVATDAACISTEDAAPGRMLAFVVRQTPRLEQLIREMQQEGVLVMQGEMMSTESWPDNLSTVAQPQHGQLSKT